MNRTVKMILCIILCVAVLIAAGVLIYFKWFVTPLDKEGMVYSESYLMEVLPKNSGSDMLGNSVGYGEGEAQTFVIHAGDEFYEDFGDELLQNPEETEKNNSMGKVLEILEVSSAGVKVLAEGEEELVEFEDTLHISSIMFVTDGANTLYEITFSRRIEK